MTVAENMQETNEVLILSVPTDKRALKELKSTRVCWLSRYIHHLIIKPSLDPDACGQNSITHGFNCWNFFQ
jgi:hypothetical protein